MAFLGALALVRAALRTHARPTSTPATVLERGTLHVLEYTGPLGWNPPGKKKIGQRFRLVSDRQVYISITRNTHTATEVWMVDVDVDIPCGRAQL